MVCYKFEITSQDIKELRLTANPAYSAEARRAGSDELVSAYICPVTGLEMNGRYKSVVIYDHCYNMHVY